MLCLSGKPRLRPSAAELVADLESLQELLGDLPPLAAPAGPAAGPAAGSPPSRLPAPRRSAPRAPLRADAPASRWVRPGATAALVAGTMLASGIATTAWHLGRSGAEAGEPPTVIVAPSAPRAAPSGPHRQGVTRAATTRPGKGRRTARGVALPAPEPNTEVRAKRPVSTKATTRSPVPENEPHGPWQCSQNFVFDLPTRTPLGPRSCHAVGRDVQFQASLTAPAGGRGRIEVSLQDAGTGRIVGGPATCDNLTFTKESFTKECGPAGVTPERGRAYAVLMSYRYTRDGRTASSTTRGAPFTF
jgi:serine/threonine-protein kinase